MTKPKSQMTPEPKPSEAEITADQAWRAGENGRRIAKEQARAGAYLKLRGTGDQAGQRLVLERVQHREAFWVLVGCHGDRKQALRLLADLAPAVPAEDKENAA